MLDLLRDIVTRKRSNPGRGQFDPQWISLYQLANADNSREILRRHTEAHIRPPGALQEQFHGGILRGPFYIDAFGNG